MKSSHGSRFLVLGTLCNDFNHSGEGRNHPEQFQEQIKNNDLKKLKTVDAENPQRVYEFRKQLEGH